MQILLFLGPGLGLIAGGVLGIKRATVYSRKDYISTKFEKVIVVSVIIFTLAVLFGAYKSSVDNTNRTAKLQQQNSVKITNLAVTEDTSGNFLIEYKISNLDKKFPVFLEITDDFFKKAKDTRKIDFKALNSPIEISRKNVKQMFDIGRGEGAQYEAELIFKIEVLSQNGEFTIKERSVKHKTLLTF